MIRRLLISTIVLISSLSVKAQVIDSLFISVPNAFMPLLDYNSRLDMLDLYNCGMTAKVYNDLGGEAVLLEKDSVHFVVQTTKSSFFEFRILTEGKDTLYSCIRSVCMPEKQSQQVFLNTNWHSVRMNLPKEISFQNCWSPNDSLTEDRIESLRLALNPACFYVHWENNPKGSPVLVYQVSVEGLLPEDQKDASLCLKSLKFCWKQGNFERWSNLP